MRLVSVFSAVLLLSLTALGCVSKSDHEALQANLDECKQETEDLQAEIGSWEHRFDRESARWNELGDSVAEAVPRALSEMHEERTKILAMVPEQVQGEVSGYLDEYFNTVMSGFDRMAKDNQDLRVEVMGMQRALEVLGTDTKAIGRAIDESLSDEKTRRQKVSEDLADIIDQLAEYDQNYLHCKRCPERLRMRDKSRAAVVAFHQELMTDLARVQTYATFADAPGLAGEKPNTGNAPEAAEGEASTENEEAAEPEEDSEAD